MKSKGLMIGFCIVDALLIGLFVFLYLQQDRVAPVIAFSEETVVYTKDMDREFLLEGVTATDGVDGDVTDSLIIEKVSDTAKGDVIVTYAAVDKANNVTKVSRVLKTK